MMDDDPTRKPLVGMVARYDVSDLAMPELRSSGLAG
jgi:hypothetical protein